MCLGQSLDGICPQPGLTVSDRGALALVRQARFPACDSVNVLLPSTVLQLYTLRNTQEQQRLLNTTLTKQKTIEAATKKNVWSTTHFLF